MGKKEYLKPLICLMPVSADVMTSSQTDGLKSFDPEWLSPNGGNENV